MGHVEVGHRWDRVAMDLLDMSVTTTRGNRYVLVMVDYFSRWTEACPLPDKTAQSLADAFFNHIVCRFGMPIVIHSDQGREFENRIMQELCILCGSHKTRTTLYHPQSDGLVERFNRTLLMMLAMFASKNREDWDDLLPAVMMAYRSSVHQSTGFSPYRLMFGEECTLPMDIGLPKQQSDLPDTISSPYVVWVRDALEVAYEQVRRYSGQVVQRQKRLYDSRAVRRLFTVGDWLLHPGEEMQAGLGMGWPLFGCVAHRLGAWNTKGPRFTNHHGTLPRSQENPTATGCGVMASYEMTANFTIGPDFGGKYHATYFSGFTIDNGFTPS